LAIEQAIAAENKLSGRWKWFSIVDKLAMSDMTKYDAIYKQSFINALNYLSYHKELDEWKAEIEKRQNTLK